MGRWTGSLSGGAAWGSMVISALAAYAEGKASNEAEGWALLWSVVDSDGEVGFWGGLSGRWCGFQHRLQLLMEASSASAKCTVRMIRAGWIEAE